MLSLLLVIACFPQFISSSSLNLIFNAANSTCTAACSTCNDTSNTNTTISNSNTALLEELLTTTRNNVQDIKAIAEATNDILLLVEDLLRLHNQSSSSSLSPLPTSCQEIKNKQPNSPSGMYLLATANDGTKYAYCSMQELCGSGGGWTRLAYMDMTDSTVNCPSGFRLHQSGGVRACGRATSSVGKCTSVQFPSGISYSQVCGRVVGYQFGSTDADYPGSYTDEPYGTRVDTNHNDINSYYVDGVSITRGSPRQHVWTLMAGLNEEDSINHDGRYNCPCSPGSPQNKTLQSFIDNDYYCESSNPLTYGTWQYVLYTPDPLWDGKDCSFEGNCCTAPGLPWFHKVLNTTTTDYLELRICGDEGNRNEDTPVSFYEFYVK